MIGIVEIVFICIFTVVYGWVLYHLPILIAGIRNVRKLKVKTEALKGPTTTLLPSFSIVVPLKNESNMVERLFKALNSLDYPKEKVELIIVEGGSNDNSYEICVEQSRTLGNCKVIQQPISDGKPSALNLGLTHCTGDIVAIFDADNVPIRDTLLKAASYFDDNNVAAVQGRTMSINSGENMLTQFVSYEEAIWCEAYLRGKDALGLFVHLKGSCQFIRRNVLQQLSGFNEKTLSEDMELSAHLAENNYNIRYGGDICAWQETPSTLKALFKQRTRWFRGTMEVALKYGRLMTKPSIRNIDAEITLFGPFIIIASLMSYLGASGTFFTSFPFNVIWRTLTLLSLLTTTVLLLVAGAVLLLVSKPKKMKNLLGYTWLSMLQ